MEKTDEQKALEIAALMEDGKGTDVCVLDVSELNSWTDYFVIVTVNSNAHCQGLSKSVKEYIGEIVSKLDKEDEDDEDPVS